MIYAERSPLRLLLKNEIVLYLRSGQWKGSRITLLVITQVALHLFALSVALGSRSPAVVAAAGPQNTPVMLGMGLMSMFLLMTSRSLGGAVQSLYTRGDLDLLLSSPVDRNAIIGVRMGSLALHVAGEVALLVWPFANVFVLFGRDAWFKAYLLVPAMAMFATSVGIATTLLSFRTLGPRRTRVAVQVLAMSVSVGIMLVLYLPGMLQQGRTRGPFADSMAVLASRGGSFTEILLVPARWVTQGFVPTLLFLLAAAVLLVLTIRATGEPIVRALIGITVGGGMRRAKRNVKGTERLGGNFRMVVVLKELKLIARDPFLIAQILQHSLLVLPMVLVLWRSGTAFGLPLPWLSTIWLASGVAGPLAWLTIVAEDAPDLLASAPVSRTALVRAKIEAAILPTLPICVLPLFFLAGSHPWFAVCTSGCALGAALTNALLNMRNPVAKRRDSFKTRYQGNVASVLLEFLQILVWFGLCLLLTWLGSLVGWR